MTRRILLESEYGIYPQPSDMEKEEAIPSIEDDLPVAPGPQMSVQLSVQRPPVEDGEFIPDQLKSFQGQLQL